MSERNAKLSEIIKRYRNISKWSDEQRRQYREKHKAFYDESNAEFAEKINELSEIWFPDMTDQPNSERFVDGTTEMKDGEKEREIEVSEGSTSSMGNNDGSQQSSSDTTASERQYFSSDEDCLLYMERNGLETLRQEVQMARKQSASSKKN